MNTATKDARTVVSLGSYQVPWTCKLMCPVNSCVAQPNVNISTRKYVIAATKTRLGLINFKKNIIRSPII